MIPYYPVSANGDILQNYSTALELDYYLCCRSEHQNQIIDIGTVKIQNSSIRMRILIVLVESHLLPFQPDFFIPATVHLSYSYAGGSICSSRSLSRLELPLSSVTASHLPRLLCFCPLWLSFTVIHPQVPSEFLRHHQRCNWVFQGPELSGFHSKMAKKLIAPIKLSVCLLGWFFFFPYLAF